MRDVSSWVQHGQYLAAASRTRLGAAGGVLSTDGVSTWLKSNIIPLLILIVGAGIVLLANKGDHRSAISRVGVVIIGLAVFAMAGAWQPISKTVLGLFGINA